MPTLDEAVEAFARRYHWRLEHAREEAKALVDAAVADALRGTPRFDLLPRELEPHAREIFEERLREQGTPAGVEVVVGSSGARR